MKSNLGQINLQNIYNYSLSVHYVIYTACEHAAMLVATGLGTDRQTDRGGREGGREGKEI